jgi:hypothetical protein
VVTNPISSRLVGNPEVTVASFHSDVKAAGNAAPFAVASAHVFAAFAASVAEGAVPSAVFSRLERETIRVIREHKTFVG